MPLNLGVGHTFLKTIVYLGLLEIGYSSGVNTGADTVERFPGTGGTWNSWRGKSPSGVGDPAEEGRPLANQKERLRRASPPRG